MTLKEKISFLLDHGYTQQKIEDETGIEQSSVSRILSETQKSVSYDKGCSLDELVARVKAFLNQQKKLRGANI
ncbi:transcriptional regulator [Acinetobacter haemolyticus]|uniref:transcriptional regulator n=1 Tax=Acinetobacter haemolyticus TaxID=29430 RepID=UPI001372EB4B|nr:transcriptional regulator [Acinetobacter haemolyticus]NAR50138.1 transcriptional regulator [Acinetobacter haemolyticus]NAR55560.1 transcriptional regulator [Acinetobacter haemolyticus]